MVDDVIHANHVNIESAVGDGMTLSECHDLALRHIRRAHLPVFAEAYHFDAHAGLTPDDLWTAIDEDAEEGKHSVLLLNFHSGIAHSWKSGGGGHFALVMGPTSRGTGKSHHKRRLLINDVHPAKYGALWSQSVETLFRAMADKDSCGRARGVLRLGLTTATNLQRPLTALTPGLRSVDWLNPPAGYRTDQLERHVPVNWDQHIGARNMGGHVPWQKPLT